MRYARIVGGAVAAYPYSLIDLRRDFPDTSFPRVPTDELLASYGVLPVAETAKPEPSDPILKTVTEGTPVLVGGTWTQTWQEVDASPEEAALRQEEAAQTEEKNAAKLDAWVTAYLAMTPAKAKQHVLDNAATLAQLRAITANLAYAVRVLIRREFNR